MRQKLFPLLPRRFVLLQLLITYCTVCFSQYKQTYNKEVGDEFTVYCTYHSKIQAVLWSYDYNVVEPTHRIYETSTSVTFRCIAASPSVGSVIQATTYYYRDNTTSSGINKDVDAWKVIVKDNSNVSLNQSSLTLNVGDSEYITALPTSSSYSGGFSWSSSSNAVSIYGSGSSARIVGNRAGTANVSVTLDNGKSASCYVTVKENNPTSVEISASATTYVGESTSISTWLIPSNAQSSLTWFCSPSSVATVSNGRVTGVGEGKATVYCKTGNGLYSNNCDVTVKYRTANGINVSPSTYTMTIGESKRFTWSLAPSNAKASVTWSSDDESIATVSSSGDVIAKKKGVTYIRATTDNGYTANCKLTVMSVLTKLSLPSNVSMYKGQTKDLQLKLIPADAYAVISWRSSDTSVLSVSSNGTILSLRPGTAIVTATAQNGVSAQCTVDILPPDAYIAVWQQNGEVAKYRLSTSPRVKYIDYELWIISDEVEIGYHTNDVRKFTLGLDFNEDPTCIDRIESENPFFLQQARPGSPLLVFDSNGRLLETGKVGANGTASYSLDAYPSGVYIIKTESTTIKILKR